MLFNFWYFGWDGRHVHISLHDLPSKLACQENDTSCWIKRDQLDDTCCIISLFNVQHVSDVNTSIFRSLRLICWVISWIVLLWFDVCWCYVVVWLGWCGIRMQAEALISASACIRIPHQHTSNQSNTIHEITQKNKSQASEYGYINIQKMLSIK